MTITDVPRPVSGGRRRGEAGERLLEVRGLRTSFHTSDGIVRAVTGVDFHVNRGEIMGLVGESGCGKSVTSLSILGLVAKPGRIEGGEIIFDGQDLLKLREREMRALRGDRISFRLSGRRGEFSGLIKGNAIEGVMESGAAKTPWSATLGG